MYYKYKINLKKKTTYMLIIKQQITDVGVKIYSCWQKRNRESREKNHELFTRSIEKNERNKEHG